MVKRVHPHAQPFMTCDDSISMHNYTKILLIMTGVGEETLLKIVSINEMDYSN